MRDVRIYTTNYCSYCKRAKELLDTEKISYEEIDVTGDDALRQELVEKYQWMTVPAIFIGDDFIGGFDDLNALHLAGKLHDKVGV